MPTVAPLPIVALDVAARQDAERVLTTLGDHAGFYKVGLQLFAAEGPAVVRWLRDRGKRVFLDLKLHDIPNTVGRAAQSAGSLGVELLTVHGLGGDEMVRAAVDGAGTRTGVLVVTALTSMDAAGLSRALGHPYPSVVDEVLRLATVARSAGAHGVVCASAECAAVVAQPGRALSVLVPGIRESGTGANDQRRISTPEAAAAAGATYVVLGRAVTQAPDAVAAYARVVASLG